MSAQIVPLYKRLHVRLAWVFSLTALLGTAISAYLTLQLAEREFQRVLAGQFSAAVAVTENAFSLVAQMALMSARHAVSDDRLSRNMCAAAPVDAAGFREFLGEIGADILVTLNGQGQVRFHSADDRASGQSLRSWRLVRQAIDDGKVGSAVTQDAENLVIYSSAVLRESGKPDARVCGVVLVGYVINDRLIEGIARNSPVDITVIRRNAVMASTFNRESRRLEQSPVPYVEYQGWLDHPDTMRRTRFGDQVYFATARRLPLMDPLMEGSMLLTQEETGLVRIQERLAAYQLGIFALTLLTMVLVAARFSNHLLRPLRQLLRFSQDILANRRSDPIAVQRQDEVGILARHVNELMERLKLYNEDLERQVAERTESLRQANETLEWQATHDALTGLPNRKLFGDRLQHAVKRAQRDGKELALLFIDLDRFKWVNDTFGHKAGDELLKEAARRMRDVVRESDTVSRLAGDEFTVLLESIGGADDSALVATKLLDALARPFHLLAGTQTVEISGSIGVARCPDHASDPDGLMRRADAAMYVAKGAGKGCYREAA